MGSLESIPEAARSILRAYARGVLCTCDLSIMTANAVEAALIWAGVNLPGEWYSAGLLTRNYSRGATNDFPDIRTLYIREPEQSIEYLEAEGPQPALAELREYYASRIWATSGVRDGSVKLSAYWYTKRLLDRPVICNALIHFRIEHRIEELRKKLKKHPYLRIGRHRLEETLNDARHDDEPSLESYIMRAFCPDNMPAILYKDQFVGTRKDQEEALKDLIVSLPLHPDSISDPAFEKVWLAPPGFKWFTKQARRRYKLGASEQFLRLIAQAKVTQKPPYNSTARIVTFPGADKKEKIGIFSTTTTLLTRKKIHRGGEQNKHNPISGTRFRVYETREDARRSQEHAIEKMSQKLLLYWWLWVDLHLYAPIEWTEEKREYLTVLIESLRKYFTHKEWFHEELISRYLFWSETGKATSSILEKPSNIGALEDALISAMGDLRGMINELDEIKKQL